MAPSEEGESLNVVTGTDIVSNNYCIVVFFESCLLDMKS